MIILPWITVEVKHRKLPKIEQPLLVLSVQEILSYQEKKNELRGKT